MNKLILSHVLPPTLSPQELGHDNPAYENGSQGELYLPAPSGPVYAAGPRLGLIWDLDRDDGTSLPEVLGGDATRIVRIGVEGMTCGSCVRSVEEVVGAVAGVCGVRASLEDGAAVIAYRPREVVVDTLRDVIGEMGFAATLGAGERPAILPALGAPALGAPALGAPALGAPVLGALALGAPATVCIWVVGMTCESCVWAIEGRVAQVAGVRSVTVSLEEGKATVTFDPSVTQPLHLRAAIEDMGFQAFLEGEHSRKDHCEIRSHPVCLDWIRSQKSFTVLLIFYVGNYN